MESWPSGQSGNCPTIAFFAPALGAGLYYQKWQIWGGIARVCRERGTNLLYVAGGQSDSTPADALYRLIDDRLVDGILSWTGVVTPRLGAEEARSFFARYAPLPVVNVGWHLPGMPSLAFDQAQGMRDLLRHLIEVHGFRRIAYLVRDIGHLGFEYQYTGYEDTCAAMGCIDPALVVEDQAGASPLTLLDRRGLRPAVDYQAAVGTNDILTMAFIEELRDAGSAGAAGYCRHRLPRWPGGAHHCPAAHHGADAMARGRATGRRMPARSDGGARLPRSRPADHDPTGGDRAPIVRLPGCPHDPCRSPFEGRFLARSNSRLQSVTGANHETG